MIGLAVFLAAVSIFIASLAIYRVENGECYKTFSRHLRNTRVALESKLDSINKRTDELSTGLSIRIDNLNEATQTEYHLLGKEIDKANSHVNKTNEHLRTLEQRQAKQEKAFRQLGSCQGGSCR